MSSDPRKRSSSGAPDDPAAKRRREHPSGSSSSSHHPHSSSTSSSHSHSRPPSKHPHHSSSSSSHKHGKPHDKHKHKPSSSHRKNSSSHKKHGAHVIPQVEANVTVKKKKSEFLCDIDFHNTLPNPPIEPKLLKIHLNHDRLLRYVGSSLEKDHKFDILTELNLGIPIDLIDLDQYMKPPFAELSREDLRILPQTRDRDKKYMPTKEQLINQKSSNWLRRADILQNNLYDKGNKQVSMIDFAEQEAIRIAKLREQTIEYNSKEKQIERILETFELALQDPVHRTNPSLTVEQIWDILPDEGLTNEYCWVRFEADPMKVAADEDEMASLEGQVAENSILKSYSLDHHGLYLPSNEELTEEEQPDENVLAREKYQWVREYVKNPTPAIEMENNFFFIQTDNNIYYSNYGSRLHLSKRVKTRTDDAEESVASRPSQLTLHIMMNDVIEEYEQQEAQPHEEIGEEQVEEHGDGEMMEEQTVEEVPTEEGQEQSEEQVMETEETTGEEVATTEETGEVGTEEGTGEIEYAQEQGQEEQMTEEATAD